MKGTVIYNEESWGECKIVVSSPTSRYSVSFMEIYSTVNHYRHTLLLMFSPRVETEENDSIKFSGFVPMNMNPVQPSIIPEDYENYKFTVIEIQPSGRDV